MFCWKFQIHGYGVVIRGEVAETERTFYAKSISKWRNEINNWKR